jgi:hypothetical protein
VADVAVGGDRPENTPPLRRGVLPSTSRSANGLDSAKARAYSNTTPAWSRAAAAQMMSGSSSEVRRIDPQYPQPADSLPGSRSSKYFLLEIESE